MSAITLRLSDSTSALLDEMVEEMEAGIADAEQGRFASDERIAQVLNRFGVRLDN